jgi:hypothetical protein
MDDGELLRQKGVAIIPSLVRTLHAEELQVPDVLGQVRVPVRRFFERRQREAGCRPCAAKG